MKRRRIQRDRRARDPTKTKKQKKKIIKKAKLFNPNIFERKSLKKDHELCTKYQGTTTRMLNKFFLQDKYDIAARAAPRCIAVQHIAAFWIETSRREPQAERASCDKSSNWLRYADVISPTDNKSM